MLGENAAEGSNFSAGLSAVSDTLTNPSALGSTFGKGFVMKSSGEGV